MELLTPLGSDGDPEYVLALPQIHLPINIIEDIVLTELWTLYADPDTRSHIRDAIRVIIVDVYHDGIPADDYMLVLDAELAKNTQKIKDSNND
jgi:hypothetical protein